MACSKAILLATEYLKAVKNPNENRENAQQMCTPEQTRWERPLQGWVKVNFDGGLNRGTKTSRLGIVMQNADGVFSSSESYPY